MGTTQITPQASVAGGLNLTSDLFKTDPSQWISGTNFIVGRPGGGANNIPGKFLAAMTCPPMRQPSSVVPSFGYGNLIPQRFFIARCDGTELWVFTETGSGDSNCFLNPPISQGNFSIYFSIGPSGAAQATLNFNSPVNISSVYRQSNWNLVADCSTEIGTQSFNVYFYNSNSSNYSLWTGTTVTGNSVITMSFVQEGGTFNSSAITSIEITSSGIGVPFAISDLRFENSTVVSYITNGLSFPHGGSSPLTPSDVSLANATDIMAVVGCQDMVLAGIYPFNTWYKLMVGFPHTSLLNSPTGSNFYFVNIPKVSNPSQSYAVLMDGASVPYLFDPNSGPGNQFTNLLPTQPQVQVITFGVAPTGGTFTLTFDGQTTGNIAYNASASTIQSDFQALSTVGTGNCTVAGDVSGATQTLTFTFTGILGFGPLPLITVTNSLTNSTTVSFAYQTQGNLGNTITANLLPTGGTYELEVAASGGGINQNSTTSALAYNATNSQIQSALQGLFLQYAGNVGVTSISGSLATGLNILFASYMGNYSGATVNVTVTVVSNSVTAGSAVTVQTPTPGSGTFAATGQQGYGGPPMKYCWTYKNMLFLANSSLDPYAVWPSDIFGTQSPVTPSALVTSGVTFENGNIVRVESSRSTKVTGGWDMDNYCLISTDTDLFILYGSNPDSTTGDFDLVLTKSKVGCIEQGAGKRVGAAFYFYSGEDIYVFDGNQSSSITNGKIQAFIDNIPISLRKSVYLGYDQERDILLVQCPLTDANSNLYFSTLTFHLASGAWGEIDGRTNSIQQINLSNYPTSGSFQITWQDVNLNTWTTAPIAGGSSVQAIQAALVATGGFQLGDIAVFNNEITIEVYPNGNIVVAGLNIVIIPPVPHYTLAFMGLQSSIAQSAIQVINNTTGQSMSVSQFQAGGIIRGMQSCCSVSFPSDGTQAKNVFFQFGDSVLEWDPPKGTSTSFNRPCTIQMAFNHTQSALIKKDLMRLLVKMLGVQFNQNGVPISLVPIANLSFYSDGDPYTVKQFISGLQPINSTIDTLNSAVDGDSFSVAINTFPTTGELDAAYVSGYTAYWQALEDL